jgi:hypothetical protein
MFSKKSRLQVSLDSLHWSTRLVNKLACKVYMYMYRRSRGRRISFIEDYEEMGAGANISTSRAERSVRRYVTDLQFTFHSFTLIRGFARLGLARRHYNLWL